MAWQDFRPAHERVFRKLVRDVLYLWARSMSESPGFSLKDLMTFWLKFLSAGPAGRQDPDDLCTVKVFLYLLILLQTIVFGNVKDLAIDEPEEPEFARKKFKMFFLLCDSFEYISITKQLLESKLSSIKIESEANKLASFLLFISVCEWSTNTLKSYRFFRATTLVLKTHKMFVWVWCKTL